MRAISSSLPALSTPTPIMTARLTWGTADAIIRSWRHDGAVAGNCGVGFAPCRPCDARPVSLMEGVEDIPEVVMARAALGLGTFPGFLDQWSGVGTISISLSCFPTHALRVFVMGQRGVRREPSTEADRAAMARLLGRR